MDVPQVIGRNVACFIAVVAMEWKIARRLSRYWVIAAILAAFFILLFLQACINKVAVSSSAPIFGYFDPYYLLNNVDPMVFVVCQMAAILLAFDASHRHRRQQIFEVLESRPLSNLSSFLGRILASAVCIWVVALVTFGVCQIVLGISSIVQFPVGRLIAFDDAARTLGILLPLYLLVASAVATFLSELVKSRFLCVLALSAFILVELLFLSGTMAESTQSNVLTLIFARELTYIVDVARLAHPIDAIAVISFIAGLCFLTCCITRRRDGFNTLRSSLTAVACLVLTGIALTTSSLLILFDDTVYREFQKDHAHRANDAHMDIERLSGTVELDPGESISIDLTYDVVPSDTTDSLIFSLNPGMEISRMIVNKHTSDFVFHNGVLSIDLPEMLEPDKAIQFEIQATGKPNLAFAYLDASLDYHKSSEIPNQLRQVLGTQASIFNNQIVALLPSIRWFPMPGRNNDRDSFQIFDLDLHVRVLNDRWTVVGPSANHTTDEKPNIGRFKPSSPIPPFTIVASQYVKESIPIGEYSIDVYTYPKHTTNVELFDDVREQLTANLSEFLDRLSSTGITHPFDVVSLVEVPHHLRMVGGGWRMLPVQSQPGIFLMKESGFPTAVLQHRIKRNFDEAPADADFQSTKLRFLRSYLARSADGSDFIEWATANLWSNRVRYSEQGYQAIEYVFTNLAARTFLTGGYTTSTFTILPAADHFNRSIRMSHSSFRSITSDPSANFSYAASDGMLWRRTSIATDHPHIWRILQRESLMDIDYAEDPVTGEKLLALKTHPLTEALFQYNSTENTVELLAQLLNTHEGKSFSLSDVYLLAQDLDYEVAPFLTEWLVGTKLPGILISPMKITQLGNNDEDPAQYRSTLHLRNDEDVEAILQLMYFPAYTDSSSDNEPLYEMVRLPGNTSKQVNLVHEFPIALVAVQPFLSLNRYVFSVQSNQRENFPQESRREFPLIEPSTWRPSSTGIIVDDLDEGFQVKQILPKPTSAFVRKLTSWFTYPQTDPAMDGNVVVYGSTFSGSPGNYWERVVSFYAWGKYRRTYATVYSPNEGVEASFETTLPHSGTWELEYHAPLRPIGARRDSYGKLTIRVWGERKPRNVTFDVKMADPSWNSLGTFEIVDRHTKVELIDASPIDPYHIVMADAIRWSPRTEEIEQQAIGESHINYGSTFVDEIYGNSRR